MSADREDERGERTMAGARSLAQIARESDHRAFVPKPFQPNRVPAVGSGTLVDLRRTDNPEHTRPILERSVAAPDGTASVVPAPDAITRRQQEVAILIAQGLSNAEIARQLTLTPGTVANHVENILRRLELSSRTSIAVWAVEQALYRSARASFDVPGLHCRPCGAPRSR